LETINRDFETLFARYGLDPPKTLSKKFNSRVVQILKIQNFNFFSAEHPNKSHSLHTDREITKTYFSTIPKSLIYKLYLFYESDYIAFGYDPPWSWLEIEPPSDS